MGAQQSARFANKHLLDATASEVNFDHFHVLRVIGKGSFGKVCIVQKRDTGTMYAMKYMNKTQCLEKEAIKNVVREMSILRHLEHPFLVNLWFSFQDEEDLFMVVDLLLGGDLRYHLQQNMCFSEDSLRLILCELASALDYLKSQSILHRDVKPENIILDQEGHAHLTDFNIATVLKTGEVAISVSGTKPYMAPEVYRCAVDCHAFYDYRVDWWSLGVCLFELSNGCRPYDIHSTTTPEECLRIFETRVAFLPHVTQPVKEAISTLMKVNSKMRPSSLEEIKSLTLIKGVNWDSIMRKDVKPPFVPPRGHLNCDPSLELEEMIMESKPLHKKKKRLLKQRSQTDFYLHSVSCHDPHPPPTSSSSAAIFMDDFVTFNRESWLAEQQRQLKEDSWEKELLEAMQASCITAVPVQVEEKRRISSTLMEEAASITSAFHHPVPPLPPLRQSKSWTDVKQQDHHNHQLNNISSWLAVTPRRIRSGGTSALS